MQRKKDNKSRILEAATAIFVARGFEGASISAIAREAQVPQSLIYHHFRDKTDLFLMVKTKAFDQSGMPEDFGGSQCENLAGFLNTIFSNRLKFYQDHPEIYPLLMWQALENKNDKAGLALDHYLIKWAQKIDEFKNRGLVRATLNSHDTALMLSAALIPSYAWNERLAASPSAYIEGLVDIFCGGLQP